MEKPGSNPVLQTANRVIFSLLPVCSLVTRERVNIEGFEAFRFSPVSGLRPTTDEIPQQHETLKRA